MDPYDHGCLGDSRVDLIFTKLALSCTHLPLELARSCWILWIVFIILTASKDSAMSLSVMSAISSLVHYCYCAQTLTSVMNRLWWWSWVCIVTITSWQLVSRLFAFHLQFAYAAAALSWAIYVSHQPTGTTIWRALMCTDVSILAWLSQLVVAVS